MQTIISKIFDMLALGFDKIPLVKELKGGRSIIGFAGLAVVAGLQAYGIGNLEILGYVQDGLYVFIGLALNSKGRE